ncbi:hypothetical protein [Bacteroides stercorirosoris]|uniref:Uncharacterized protein n=1 Tax=Bacteroides stercorirosoris TaxID=871324 RepID=A0A1M6GHJ8_9BACE|nr:hypothetical protein [Bacteroides stercorirosoris]SHJ09434.1 hypothetical protein SAMN05444350_11536 [Bacteroides stercorirosoris]
MKSKILFGIMALVIGVLVTGCSDDDYAINATPLLTDSSVVTGSADVTATSATLHGTVSGLENQSASAYVTGFNYGAAVDDLTERIVATGGDEFAATVTGSVNQTIYYQAYVTLQGKVTYKGVVKSLVLTNARATTGDATQVGANKATLAGSLADFPTDAESGIMVSGIAGTENVRAGVRIATDAKGSYTVNVEGLLPNTTYYYVAYLDLGAGVVYGEEKSFTTTAHVFDLDNDLVDLGLSTKWAKYNVGATSETEIGGLFGFGDMTGFNTSIDPAHYASADIYKTVNDIANKAFGGKVTMPTIAEFEELFALCTKEWVEVEGVAGYKFTGPNGNSIFMPAAGSRTQGTVTGAGMEGYYLSGSINASDGQFAMSYHFNSAADTRTTTPVYQALAIRPVSAAKNVPFVKDLLYQTWEIDLKSDGSYLIFPGPTYFYGMDDSWRTVSNGEPVLGDSWCWAADFAGNSWAVGGSADNCRGTMTFSKEEDGTNKVVVSQVTAEGTFVESEGTFTINEEDKTLTLDVDILAPANFVPDFVNDKKTNIKILSLTESAMQLAVVRTDPTQGAAQLSVNYIPQLNKYGFTAKLTCYGGGDAPDGWNSAVTTIPAGDAGVGTYTITFNAEAPRTFGQVYVLDIEGYATAYPNALVRIDAIKADGKEVKFDAGKFFYGNIEGGGNYRVELANIWGCGHNDGWNGLKDTPFQEGGGETTEETALAFESTFEVTFTIVSISSNGAGVYTPNLVTVNPSWTSDWGFNQGATFEVKYENFQYILDAPQFDIKYEATDYAAGSIMTFIEVADLYGFFPGAHATLDNLYLDGTEVTFDATKVLDANESPKYRLELWNCYGATKTGGCAFGTPDGDVIKELGFSSSMEVKFTFHNLFAVPQW